MNRDFSSLRPLLWLGGGGLTVVMLALFLGVYLTPAVHAEEPPDDCWGGDAVRGSTSLPRYRRRPQGGSH